MPEGPMHAAGYGYDPKPKPPAFAMPPVTLPVGPLKEGSLMASARKLTKRELEGSNMRVWFQGSKEWQKEAWDMFDDVGEERFLATTLAGRLAQAKLYVGRHITQGDEPEPVENPMVQAILDQLAGGPVGRAQLLYRLGVNLFVAGEGWIVSVTQDNYNETTTKDWYVLSISEISTSADDLIKIKLPDANGNSTEVEIDPDKDDVIRVWRPHPRHAWEADSPTRASLPVLREMVGLTMHISAQIESRLAGAGILVVPQSAQRSLAAQLEMDDGMETSDVFTEALIQAMMTPIGDRDSAAAVVPLVAVVPDEVTRDFQHLTFSSPLDGAAKDMREDAIRRLALGQDAPPELLLGTAGMNHWGGWLVQQDVVATHLEPPLSLICDGLTTQYLWPRLEAMGMPQQEIEKYAIWYDVKHLITRPDISNDAITLFQGGILSAEATRRAVGFDESDAPVIEQENDDPALAMAIELVTAAPALISAPGLPEVVKQIKAAMNNEPYTPPDKNGTPAPPDPEPGSSIGPAEKPAPDSTPVGTDGKPLPQIKVPKPSSEAPRSPSVLPRAGKDARIPKP